MQFQDLDTAQRHRARGPLGSLKTLAGDVTPWCRPSIASSSSDILLLKAVANHEVPPEIKGMFEQLGYPIRIAARKKGWRARLRHQALDTTNKQDKACSPRSKTSLSLESSVCSLGPCDNVCNIKLYEPTTSYVAVILRAFMVIQVPVFHDAASL